MPDEAAAARHRAEQTRRADQLVMQGGCPDCGRSAWQCAASNGTQTVRCIECGAAFLIDRKETA